METTTAAALYSEMTIPVMEFTQVLVLILVVLPLAAFVGHLFGCARRKSIIASGQEVDLTEGQTSLSAFLALLGLLIAFSFGSALALTETRKTTMIAEAAAIGTAFLRADYLAEPGRTELKVALHDYAQTRMVPQGGTIHNIEEAIAFLDASLQAQAKLWPLTLKATADPLPVPIKTFVAASVNDALDAHSYRMQTMSAPMSHITQMMLLAAGMVSLFLLGSRSGVRGKKLSWHSFVFSGFVCAVMLTTVDLQRGGEGLIQTDQTPMLALIHDMERALQ